MRAAHLLSDGQKALLQAYPDTWRMNVHRTRRSAAYPAWVYEAVRANATRARVDLEGAGSVTGARIGPPFPIPQSGVEVRLESQPALARRAGGAQRGHRRGDAAGPLPRGGPSIK